MNQQTDSPIFTLPPEIREVIYELSLTAADAITNPEPPSIIANGIVPEDWKTHIPALGAALTRTCRRINSEMDMSPLYRNNTFRFTRLGSAEGFLASLTPAKLMLLKYVVLDYRSARRRGPGKLYGYPDPHDWGTQACTSIEVRARYDPRFYVNRMTLRPLVYLDLPVRFRVWSRQRVVLDLWVREGFEGCEVGRERLEMVMELLKEALG